MSDRQSTAATDGQAQSDSQPQSQSLGSSDGPLRHITTFKFEDGEKSSGENAKKDTTGNSAEKKGPSPGLVDKIMTKLGLTPIMLMCMFKASVAPIIALAIYQAPAIKNLLTTLGYLTGIISVLSLVALPRGKFLQNMGLSLLFAGIGGGMGTLIVWSSVQARLNTSDAAALAQYIAQHGSAPYNSSQSAVCGVWLFFNIWAANTARARFPAFNVPVIVYSIIVNIASTFGPRFPTVAAAEAFIRELLIAIFLGFAIGTGCSLFIFPISTRQIVVKQMTGVLGLFKKTIALQKEYIHGLESDDMFTIEPTETAVGQPEREQKNEKRKGAGAASSSAKLTKEQQTAMALRGVTGATRELMGKIYGDLKFAKRDVAFGYLSAHDFGALFSQMRNIAIPLGGIGIIMDIFQKVARDRGWDGQPASDELGTTPGPVDKGESQRMWNDIMTQLHEPFEILSEAVVQGIDHAGILLRFFPQPKGLTTVADDVEDSAAGLRPGQMGFAQVIDDKIGAFNSRKGEILRLWAKEKGLSSDGKLGNMDKHNTRLFEKRRNDQAQLFVLLYLEKLMQATGEAVQDFVAFAEEKHRDGSITKKHFIFPDGRRLRKWLFGIFTNEDSTADESPDLMERGGNVVFLGQGWMQKKDPEHLAPTNFLQKLGNALRDFSNFFGSAEAVFGLRVACATMTVGILAFLEQTQAFFFAQRLVWAMIIIAIGMTQTSGQSIFGFFLRTAGTFFAMVASFIIWYIVDHQTPGVLVFLWLFIFIGFYFFLKYPQFIPGILICIVTMVLIIGYELQVESLGVAAATASGQPYYPLYQLAPYRLATVAGGCLVAFIWTVFPRPTTDRTWLRKDLSATIYILANYSSVIYTTMRSTLRQDLGDVEVPGSPANSLFKIRRKLYGKLSLLLPSLQIHSNYQRFEPNLGGKFPTEQYQEIIRRCTRMMNYFTMMSYVLTWAPRVPDESDRAWMRLLSEVLDGVTPIHTQILSTLTLLSNCLLSGQSLPPYLPLPRPYEILRHLLNLPAAAESERRRRAGDPPSTLSLFSSHNMSSNPSYDTIRPESRRVRPPGGAMSQAEQEEQEQRLEPEAWNLLDARNMEQQGYTEFAVLQVCSMLIVGELKGMIEDISELVGTVDFSFRVDHGEAGASDTSLESFGRVGTWASRAAERKGKGKND